MAQRRFSQVDEAIARHNTRRQAKRSQSVYQRQVLSWYFFARFIYRVRKLNLGWRFLASKVAFSWPSLYRSGKHFWGLITLGQVKSVPNIC